MSTNFIHEDLRGMKTKRALYAAMFSLLKKSSFKKITIKCICEEAFISRAAFYAHFVDKYDLLLHWLVELWPVSLVASSDSYEQIETTVNYYIYENKLVLKNLVYDADNETFGILFDFILSIINNALAAGDTALNPKHIVISHILAGGIVSYLIWQVKSNFPPFVPPMNKTLYRMIHELQEWYSL